MKQSVPSGKKKKRRRILVSRVVLCAGVCVIVVGGFAFFLSNLFGQSHSQAAQSPRQQSKQQSSAPSAAPAPAASTPASSAASTISSAAPASSSAQAADLSGSAMVGNSYVEDLQDCNLLPQMDFFDRVGLNLNTVFTKTTTTGHVPVIDELSGKSYSKVYLLFGENELGWYDKPFYDDYGKVVDAVRQRQPNATIYIQSIFPISAAESAKNIDQTNNQRIVQVNGMLQQLAQAKGAKYLDAASAVIGPDGNLPDGAAPDGIHFNKSYCQKWVDYLKTHV